MIINTAQEDKSAFKSLLSHYVASCQGLLSLYQQLWMQYFWIRSSPSLFCVFPCVFAVQVTPCAYCSSLCHQMGRPLSRVQETRHCASGVSSPGSRHLGQMLACCRCQETQSDKIILRKSPVNRLQSSLYQYPRMFQ